MKRLLLSLILISTSTTLFSQLEARLEIDNPTLEINDGIATAEVTNGEPPYTYKWTRKETSRDSDVCIEITENHDFSVLITDAKGDTAMLKGVVPAESIEERMNAFFIPVVDAIASVLFWDPFDFIGVYDPVV